MLRRAANARENDAIGGIRVRRALVQRRHARRVVLYRHDGGRDAALAKRLGQLRRGRRAGNEGNAFAVQIRDALDAGGVRDEQAGAVDEGQEAEIHQLVTRERGGRGAALEVDRAPGDGLDPVFYRDLHPVQLEIRQAELLADAGGDERAEVDRIARGLALRVREGKRAGGFVVPERDRLGVLDLLQRAVEVDGKSGGAQQRREQQQQRQPSDHRELLFGD